MSKKNRFLLIITIVNIQVRSIQNFTEDNYSGSRNLLFTDNNWTHTVYKSCSFKYQAKSKTLHWKSYPSKFENAD